MRNWIIAMAVGGMLTGLSHTASAQEIKRTGSGFAKSECFFSAGSCGGLAPETCSGPDCNVSVSGNGTIFPGFDGQANLNMSEMSIQASGNASFTPPSPCTEGTFTGGPGYIADGSQSIYADVPNGTPIRITIASSLSGSGGGGATWSDAKSGTGGVSGTTVFNAVAGPGKITDSGVDYYLIDTIRARGSAGASRKCDEPNDQSFSGSVSLTFKVIGPTTHLEKIDDGDGQQTLVSDILSKPLQVRVSGLDTNGQALLTEGVVIAWTVTAPDGVIFSQFQSETDSEGVSAVTVPLGSKIGQYTITAVCSECIVNREVSFTATVLSLNDATNLDLVACDGNGVIGSKTTNPMKVRAVNVVTGGGRGGVAVSFTPSGSVSVEPTGQTTAVGSGLASTTVKVAGSGSVTASCGQCKGNQSVTCNLTSIPEKPRAPDQAPSVGGDGDPVKPGTGDFRMGIQFQAQQPRIGLTKTIVNSSMDRIGVIAGDSVRFFVLTTPDQQLSDSDISWQGEGAGSGNSLLVYFPTPGLRQVTASVAGKQVQARIDVAPAPPLTQKEFCLTQPILCGLALFTRAPAITWSQSVAASIGRGARNGPQDAVRHAYWNALMTVRVAGFIAEGVGTGHEGTNIAAGESHNEPVMDMENNAIGRQIGQALLDSGLTSSQIPDSELQSRVLSALKAGQLTIMDEGGRNGTSLTGLLRQSR